MTVTSRHSFGPHLHFSGGGLFNHGGCCSTPYEFTLNPGGSFDLVGFDQKNTPPSIDVWTAFQDGSSVGTFSPTGTGLQTFPSSFTDITKAEWNVNGTSIIDDLEFRAAPEPTS